MGKRKRKRYSPKFKFQVVLEVLRNPGTGAEVARCFAEMVPNAMCRGARMFHSLSAMRR